MKRYDCTIHDKRGAFGLCMEARSEGQFVPFTRVEQLQAKINGLLEERNTTGLAINKAILSGIVPDQHPIRSRLELLANHHKREQAQADLVSRMVTIMKLAGEVPEKDALNPVQAWMYDAITTMAGQRPKQSVAVTETIRTAPERIWLQVGDQSHYHSEPFPSDTSEVSWCADSVVGCEVPYVRADLAGKMPDHPKRSLNMTLKQADEMDRQSKAREVLTEVKRLRIELARNVAIGQRLLGEQMDCFDAIEKLNEELRKLIGEG
ncbi:hypothetical protein ACW5W8_11480 [Aeromonas aquatilis]